MPRGGKRQGRPGQAYGNRTDLNAKPRAPITAVPGQPYGEAGAQIEAQRAVPMGVPGLPTPPRGRMGNPPPVSSVTTDPIPLDAPSMRPGEPVTAGVPSGPGPGPEALNIPDEEEMDLALLAPYLPALELMSSQPFATSAGRNFVRRIRGAIAEETLRASQTPVQETMADRPLQPMGDDFAADIMSEVSGGEDTGVVEMPGEASSGEA